MRVPCLMPAIYSQKNDGMLGNLSETQVNNILLSQAVGRIGCSENDQPYIVPVNYVFDGTAIYGQTQRGKKLDIMRANPNVCFQVDLISQMGSWQSVLITGTFHELLDEEAGDARRSLYNKVFPLLTDNTIHSHEHEVLTEIHDANRVKEVMYRIVIKTKTGRFEKP